MTTFLIVVFFLSWRNAPFLIDAELLSRDKDDCSLSGPRNEINDVKLSVELIPWSHILKVKCFKPYLDILIRVERSQKQRSKYIDAIKLTHV